MPQAQDVRRRRVADGRLRWAAQGHDAQLHRPDLGDRAGQARVRRQVQRHPPAGKVLAELADQVLPSLTAANEPARQAIGRDRCIGCGRSSIFEHKNRQVDRSEQRIRTLVAEIEDLIVEGVKLAVELSDKLNELLLAEAEKCAAVTGEPQSPARARIAGAWHRCAVCSTGGRAETVVSAPAAAMALPPGTDNTWAFC